MPLDLFLVFAATTAVVVIAPGPAAVTVASLSAGNGLSRAMVGILGVAFANAVYFMLSAFGIASLMIASHTVFTVIKWAGVLYLVYLGISAILGGSSAINVKAARRQSTAALFSKGFVVEFANPKALLYFAAIVPQFLDTSQSIVVPLMIMGVTTLILDLVIYSIYALMGRALVRGGAKDIIVTIVNKVAGGAFLLAGVKMATVSA
ncbi:MAG: LysE family translocator [Pseudomonadota bacterium]